jgi:hypothetical protein
LWRINEEKIIIIIEDYTNWLITYIPKLFVI